MVRLGVEMCLIESDESVWVHAIRGKSVNLHKLDKDKLKSFYIYGGERWSKTRVCICM